MFRDYHILIAECIDVLQNVFLVRISVVVRAYNSDIL